MHPSHVPLEGKAQPVLFGMLRHLWPRGGFLGNDKSTVVAPLDYCVQVLKELDGFQVLVASVFVGDPLAFLASVVQVQHGCHRVHPEAVHVVLFHPVERIADEEVLDLIFTVIKYLGAPVRMFALPGVRIFKKGFSVKVSQAMGILGKVGRNPVQYDAYAVFMQVVYEIHELFRCAIAGGRGKVSRHLISPGTVKWMFCNAHQLHMGIAHLFYISCQLMGCLCVCIKAVLFRPVPFTPGTQMHFVNAHGQLLYICLGPLFDPRAVSPGKALDIGCDRGCTRTVFSAEGKGICLVENLAGLGGNGEFIELSQLHARIENLPDTGFGDTFHGAGLRIPVVKIAYQMDLFCVGGPDGEVDTFLSLVCLGMCP